MASPTQFTQFRVAVVGCGFVGSIFVTEFLKRCFAGKLPWNFRLIDFDTVEDRNVANQNFQLSDVGQHKAQVLGDLVVNAGRDAEVRPTRLRAENADDLLGDCALIVDGVDNLATRQLLWGEGLRRGVPVLHLGITQQGTGVVEWTHPEHRTFSLAPDVLLGKELVDPPSGVTPPCELARMRAAGLHVGFAAACAAAIYSGFDPEAFLAGSGETGDSRGWLTEWQASPTGFQPAAFTWGRVTPPDIALATDDAPDFSAAFADDALAGVD